MAIALKQANEINYWLNLLRDTQNISSEMFESMSADCTEIIKMLVATVKTMGKPVRT